MSLLLTPFLLALITIYTISIIVKRENCEKFCHDLFNQLYPAMAHLLCPIHLADV